MTISDYWDQSCAFCYKAQLVDSLYQPQHMVVGLVKQKL